MEIYPLYPRIIYQSLQDYFYQRSQQTKLGDAPYDKVGLGSTSVYI